MNDERILVYEHGWFLHFGIAKILQSKLNCKLYGIIDFGDKSKKFFDNQKIVNFEKIWHYNNVKIDFKKKPDIEYLKSIEKKYKINLWNTAYTDKNFYQYNEFHQFSTEEILIILEQECKFFEKILDEAKPKAFLTYHTQNHHQHLIFKMCKAKGIKMLMLSPAKLAKKFFISEDGLLLDSDADDNNEIKIKIENKQDAISYLEKWDTQSYIAKTKNTSFESNIISRYKYILKYFLNKNKEISNQYQYFGMSKTKVLKNKIKRSMQRKKMKTFIDNNFLKIVPSNNEFIYFPLHYEPERVLLVSGQYFDNQLSMISNIAKSIPIGYKLFVKENPSQGTIGWRDESFYKYIMSLPNVELLHPSIKSKEIISKCSLVVTIAGTTGFEAVCYNKPAIMFSDQIYSKLSFVVRLREPEKLTETIKTQLNRKTDFKELEKFINILENNSVVFALDEFGADFAYRFGFKGPVMEAELPEQEIRKFLDKYDELLTEITEHHIKKLKLTN